jgi:Immunoglobulin domain/PQQ-like domain
MRFLGHLGQWTLALSLIACGGNGSSGSPNTPPPEAVAPQISVQPANQSVTAGQTATFNVTATGTAPVQYQWNRSGTAISGASSATYTTPATTSADNGASFAVLVSNSAGSMTSQPAVLTVTAAAAVAPQISAQPTNQSVSVGQTATFSVTATGTSPLQYQWNKNGTAISGGTSATYTTPATTSGDNGASFTVKASNSAGSVASQAAVLTVTTPPAPTGADVVTYKYDAMRSGQNLAESTLTTANVSVSTFGKLNNLMVDGRVDAQPLYLSGLMVAAASHNVVFVETEHDSAYAFDADTGGLLWHVSLVGAGETPSDARGCNQIVSEIGITATPVIDRHAGAHGTIYVVAMSKDGSSNYHQRLHALDVTTGAELLSGPTEIQATYVASSFSPGQYEERAALLLSNGTIYTSWTSHCDIAPYGGWIIAFNESTLAIDAALNVALGASGSGYANQGPAIWMSGGGPAADAAGNIYLLTANGRFETTLTGAGFPSGGDYGNSFLKLSLSGTAMSVTDYFTMSGEVAESGADKDLGSGGILLLPDMTDASGNVQHLAIGAGKDGNLYVVSRDNMGKFSSVGNNIWQELDGVLPGGIWSTPAYFNSNVFYGPSGGSLLAFPISNAKLASAPASRTSTAFPYPGTLPVVSANGTGNAIVWAYDNSSTAVLHAYLAGNLATELYNSNQAANGRDNFGSGNKFIVPLVVDGKVFVATTNSVAIFGLLQ